MKELWYGEASTSGNIQYILTASKECLMENVMKLVCFLGANTNHLQQKRFQPPFLIRILIEFIFALFSQRSSFILAFK